MGEPPRAGTRTTALPAPRYRSLLGSKRRDGGPVSLERHHGASSRQFHSPDQFRSESTPASARMKAQLRPTRSRVVGAALPERGGCRRTAAPRAPRVALSQAQGQHWLPVTPTTLDSRPANGHPRARSARRPNEAGRSHPLGRQTGKDRPDPNLTGRTSHDNRAGSCVPCSARRNARHGLPGPVAGIPAVRVPLTD